MARLIQGDVGCGKTVVAGAAAARAAGSGGQVALMAPTELLAEQHWSSFSRWFHPLGFPVARLSGSLGARAKRSALSTIAAGDVQIVVGTHALFQEGVQFARLALVIVDEQHRFGVQQRLQLKEKGRAAGILPHQLIMTATPIPRTLAMTAYADLDTTVIDSLPPGRQPRAHGGARRGAPRGSGRAHRARVSRGSAGVLGVSVIEESEELEFQAAEETAAALAEALPGIHVALVHGRMPPAKKEQTMQAFKAGTIQLLVATTVIEVGVDVPNASLMVGRKRRAHGTRAAAPVARGAWERRARVELRCCSIAIRSRRWRARLAALRESNDGFEIARRDLELRDRASCWAHARRDSRSCAWRT